MTTKSNLPRQYTGNRFIDCFADTRNLMDRAFRALGQHGHVTNVVEPTLNHGSGSSAVDSAKETKRSKRRVLKSPLAADKLIT